MNLSPQRETALLSLITQAIETGAPAPSNPTICNVLGFKSIASASDAVRVLERKGLIKVDRHKNTRVIRMHDHTTRPTQQQEMRRVSRSVCFWCGVRSDVGCKHGEAA